MIASDEDALICDFVQFYHVLDWRALRTSLAATLAAGLPKDSRSFLRICGQRLTTAQQLQAASLDSLNRIEWRLIGCPGHKPPDSVLSALEAKEDSKSNVQAFASPDDFEAALAAAKGR